MLSLYLEAVSTLESVSSSLMPSAILHVLRLHATHGLKKDRNLGGSLRATLMAKLKVARTLTRSHQGKLQT